MTTAASLRADALQVLQGEGVGLRVSMSQPAGTSTYDPASGTDTPAVGDPESFGGWGRITRFSDALAAGPGLIDNSDRKIVWYPDDPTVKPVNDGIMTATNADGSTQDFKVIAWNARDLGGSVIHYIIQGRR